MHDLHGIRDACSYFPIVSIVPQVNTFYNLVTDFYEWGWGTSFHFSPQLPGKTQCASRHCECPAPKHMPSMASWGQCQGAVESRAVQWAALVIGIRVERRRNSPMSFCAHMCMRTMLQYTPQLCCHSRCSSQQAAAFTSNSSSRCQRVDGVLPATAATLMQ